MTDTAVQSTRQGARGVPRFARLPVLAVAGTVALVLGVTSGRYAHGFDELYFMVAGRDHLDWGYFDQPPLVPLLAGAMDHLFPGSLVALRLPVTLAAAAGVVVTALIARELGGGRAAQAMAGGLYAMSGIVVASHWMATYVLDPFFWTLVCWLVVRWVRLRDDRCLLWAGLVTTVSLQTKFLIPALWAGLLLAALVLGPRELPGRPKLWLGAAVAVAVAVPTLLWQAANGWPYLNMGEVVAAEFPGTGAFLWSGLLGAGVGVGALGLLYGLWRLLRSPELRPYRFVAVAVLAVAVAVLLASGRSNYLFGLYAVPFAAAAVELRRRRPWRRLRVAVVPAFVLSAVITVAALPVYPRSVAREMPPFWGVFTLGSAFASGELPQRELAETIARAYASLPPERRARTAVFAEIYPFAAAVDYYGAGYGVPRAYSGHRGYWYFGPPPESAEDVLFAGFDPELLRPYFAERATVVDGLLWTYRGRDRPWTRIWPELRTQ